MISSKNRVESPEIVLVSRPPSPKQKALAGDSSKFKAESDDEVTMINDTGTHKNRMDAITGVSEMRIEMEKLRKEKEKLRVERDAARTIVDSLEKAFRVAKEHQTLVKPQPNVKDEDVAIEKDIKETQSKATSTNKDDHSTNEIVENSGSEKDASDQEDEDRDPNDFPPVESFEEPEPNFFQFDDVPRDRSVTDHLSTSTRSSRQPSQHRTPAGSSRGDVVTLAATSRNEAAASSVSGLTVEREPSPDLIEVKVMVEVKVKVENQEDELKKVYFTKSEDGMLDIWNLDGFDLGPEIRVDPQYDQGFTRKVIGDAFGGSHQTYAHHWHSEAKLAEIAKERNTPIGTPFLTFSRQRNPQLPAAPGQHGVVFYDLTTFGDGAKVDIPLTLFAREGSSDWRQLGLYSVKRWGEISPQQFNLLPPKMVTMWVNGALDSDWGMDWINATNGRAKTLAEATNTKLRPVKYTKKGMRAALADGRLTISFTIIQCVGFRYDWHEQLLHYKAHPKPPIGAQKRKRSTGKGAARASKIAKGKGGKKIVKRQSDIEISNGDGEGPSGDAKRSLEAENTQRNRRISRPSRRSRRNMPLHGLRSR